MIAVALGSFNLRRLPFHSIPYNMTSILKRGLTVVHNKFDCHDIYSFHIELYKDGIYIGEDSNVIRHNCGSSDCIFEIDIDTQGVLYIFTYQVWKRDNETEKFLSKYKETGDYTYRNVRFIQRDDVGEKEKEEDEA